MDLDEMLGVDLRRPEHAHAQALVAADELMLDDLIRLREMQGLKQTDVADRMGISPSSVCRLESGERDPHLSTLRRYAMAVGAVVAHRVTTFELTPVEESWAGDEGVRVRNSWDSLGGNRLALLVGQAD